MSEYTKLGRTINKTDQDTKLVSMIHNLCPITIPIHHIKRWAAMFNISKLEIIIINDPLTPGPYLILA